MADVWELWAPAWAVLYGNALVWARYTRREWDAEAGMHQEQRIEARCFACGAEWRGGCSSGHVRDKIARFARVHLMLHVDPLAAPRVVRPGSLRSPPPEDPGEGA